MILAIDTSGARVVVAVAAHDGDVGYEGSGSRPRSHAEEIGPLVAAAQRTGPIAHVVVGRGPGSFTGLRVGLAFGQVWAWARKVPVSGICSLDVVAEQSALDDGWVVMDARRRELFAARYREGRRTGEPLVLPRDEAATRIAGDRVVGDVELIGEPDRRVVGTCLLDPGALGRVAARAVRDGATGTLQPDYLRRPDVTMSAANRGGGA